MRTTIWLYGIVLLSAGNAISGDREVVPLWPEGAPSAQGTEQADAPTLTITLPAEKKGNGTAVVICPGGGYGGLAVLHEGAAIADWLAERGVTAFMLRYRHAPKYQHPIPLADASRALRWVRAHAEKFHLDPRKIGIWGFSAGGHLASTLATHFDPGNPDARDPIDRLSSRPDFAILCYPVITMKDPYCHAGSRRNLLGEKPPEELIESLSNETQVTENTPPTFLFHTTTDKPVPPENSILFYTALSRAGVPCELHIYEQGPHGVGLANKDPILASWPSRLEDWLKLHKLLTEK